MQTQGRPPGRQAWQLAWPFTGREDELAWVAARRREGTCCGVVVSGAPGVGKTRLARELLASGIDAGVPVEWVQATRAAASVPLGAFAALFPPGSPGGDQLQLFQFCADTMRQRAGGGRVLLGVDDAQLLDPASAALVLHLARTSAFVVVTVRAGEPCQDSIVALWKDIGAPRLELQQLSEAETAVLLGAVLGGEVEPTVLRWAFGTSEGNLLYLRELVTGALASGDLEEARGRWRLGAPPRPSPALVELVSARLAGLSGDEFEMVQLLALGEPLPLETVDRMGATPALSRLEERGLAVVAPERVGDVEGGARLSHPVYGEAVRSAMPSLRANELRLRLAVAVQEAGMARPGDALRVATWLEDAGAPITTSVLLHAARQANAASDPDLAERLAGRAGTGSTAEAALVVARAHVLRRRFAEAEDLLATLEGDLRAPELAAGYLAERAVLVLHLGLGRLGEALRLLARAKAWFPGAAWQARVGAIELEIRAANARGEPAEVIDAAERVLQRDDQVAQVRRRVLVAYAFSLHHVGRTARARTVSEQLRPVVPLGGDDDVFALVAWPLVCFESGYDWDEVEAWLSNAEQAARLGDQPLTCGQVVAFLGAFAVARGRPVTAARRLREAVPSLMRRDPRRRLASVLLYLVMASAMSGDLGAAREAEAEYRAVIAGARVPYLGSQEVRALAALAVAEGKTTDAAQMLLAAAYGRATPTERGHLLYQALRAHAEPRVVASALRAVAACCDAPLIEAFAAQAVALAEGDGAALVDAANALGQIGAWLWAAEAAAQGAVAHAHAGRSDSSRRALALSGRFRDQCEDVRSPVLAAVELAPSELTRREREVVELASRGVPNAEIAAQLVLSVRTVESHLYRAMAKLGVNDRHELRSQYARTGGGVSQ
jgi:DNA-binding NarL/FixJ family response regulator